MRRAALAVAAAALAGCSLLGRDFRLSGTVTLAPELRHKVPTMNAVLFIVAKNRGGVPLAVRRIVNPQFPIAYTLSAEDLVVPGTRPRGPFRIVVQMNTHGNVGAAVKGDFEGQCPDMLGSGERGAHVVIDRQL